LFSCFFILILSGCGNDVGDTSSGENNNDKETYELNLSHMYTENEPGHEAALLFSENAEEKSDGRLKVVIHSNSTLGSDQEITEQAALGENVIGVSNPSYLMDYSKDIGILNSPFLVNDWEELKKIINSDYMDEQKEKFEN